MKPNDLREKTDSERKKLLKEWKEELFALGIKRKTGQLEKTHKLGDLKQDIARLLTLNREEPKNTQKVSAQKGKKK
ncbi:MAG: 50S ribosomal protein L29 [Deltaproteobacteria bacterium RIFCSPLOWO2_12_FULL_40_28]|nr:MAG: 50S ribosomal protein L29 [Deltaproteobacteria bacterium RIFCSPHIGHO2_02_FULL_40_28]OGQ19001.1 MAG: 50S ribosomal protein L29 [Deltaproteobacteria bacterium RIFCSPHIGHO2_12_FULL_40_32]OGQ39544.1 MAG: 50S ribosomal protein L29 [Deltaproteobacteria bacterium RIFCSPLOWO2_02_FULL_40_36]OGQ53434.1 MAG: 50S ribosomal protein L29 [Deltaproteobacteria bacterium RIFCSPLOWO2_12_FULL_40_28]